MKKIEFFSILCLCGFCFFASCSKNVVVEEKQDAFVLEIQNSADSNIINEPQKWHITNKRICVLFGYGYNDVSNYSEIITLLEKKYGLSENGGLIYPLIYPESFKHGARWFESDFLAELEDTEKDFCAVVTLGAPERTHSALARHQDFWKQKVPFPVVSLFPQDDVLGTEATSDFVIEKAQVADLTGAIVAEEEESVKVEFVETIICDVIDYLLCTEGTFSRDSDLLKHVSQILKGRKFHRYSDPETGLQAVNHFVLY